MLGLGNILVSASTLSGYENNFGLRFDGTSDYALTGISGQDPADGTIKPYNPSGFTVAAWCKLDIDGVTNPYDDTGTYRIVSAISNGGWSLHYANKAFVFSVNLEDGDGNIANNKPQSTLPYMKNLLANNFQYLHKSDGWHFVVGTWDGDRVKNLYVDGGRDVAGSTTPVNGVADFGSQPEDSGSKITEAASSGGAWTVKYDTTADRDEVDIVIGATGNMNSSTDVTTANGSYWEGYIGDVAIWDKELTSAEITALYNLHKPTDMSTTQPDNLLAYWKMEEGSGTVLAESTGNVGANGTISGAAFDALAPTLDVSGYNGYQ